ncbi:Fe-S cluster assembly protein SufD [Xanthovirga aplysinae]|uniref:Fe-S cluster assembly protein SufD n=1 Tax=Xanthovirga aplysinae TaxID=2529853 RepID=UPI0012BB67C8|nr:Fe-S cluster assembly protein SufD [Xanthovirga aplysinae]MTI30907.1 Fe-S cluster assembly protein SufD [Xanthovirga aplysinae]
MSQIADKADIKDTLLANFEALKREVEAKNNAVLNENRNAAFAAFEKLGLPGAKSEYYKYTDITKVLKKQFAGHSLAPQVKISSSALGSIMLEDLEANVLVFVNGRYSKEHSNIISPANELVVTELSEAAVAHKEDFEKHFAKYANVSEDAFTALNTAFTQEGAFIKVAENKIIEKPIIFYFITDSSSSQTVSYPRNLFLIGENSQVNFVESYQSIGEERNLTNSVTEIVVGENAYVNYHKIQADGENAYHIGTTQVYQTAKSTFNAITITLSGAVVRNNLNIVLDAENCESHMYGLYLLKDQQHVDNHTMVDHKKPNCFSNELYKGVMDDKSTGVFNGRIFVRQDAQKTNAFQSNKNIIISDKANMYTKPQLEIWADDVKCSHGCTTGQLDEEQLFYLRARGIDKKSAKAMLLQAFAKDVLENIKIEPLKKKLEEILEARLHV